MRKGINKTRARTSFGFAVNPRKQRVIDNSLTNKTAKSSVSRTGRLRNTSDSYTHVESKLFDNFKQDREGNKVTLSDNSLDQLAKAIPVASPTPVVSSPAPARASPPPAKASPAPISLKEEKKLEKAIEQFASPQKPYIQDRVRIPPAYAAEPLSPVVTKKEPLSPVAATKESATLKPTPPPKREGALPKIRFTTKQEGLNNTPEGEVFQTMRGFYLKKSATQAVKISTPKREV